MPDQLFCYIRKRWITATPEEKIRQFLIKHLIENLQYPQHNILLEKGLNQLPHLDPAVLSTIPQRRIDLIILDKDLHPHNPLHPLLLIECKATPLTAKVMRQIMGYNHYIRSCFVAIANQTEILLGWMHPQQNILQVAKGIPPYPILKKQAKLFIRGSWKIED